NTGDAIDVGVTVSSTFTNTPLDASKVVNAAWTLTNVSGSGTPDLDLTLEWASAQHAGSFSTASDIFIGYYNSGWTGHEATLTDLGSGRYSANAIGFASLTEFGVGNTGSLPVELTSFNGKVANGKINLNWNTATEVNNYGFEVERAKAVSGNQNFQFAKVGFVEGNGNSNSPKSYSFTDANVTAGIYIYRLKQVDTDGQFEYSQVIEVSVANLINGYLLEQNYPNPFNPSTIIKFGFQNDTRAEVKVYNVIGAEVATLFNGIADAGRIYEVTFDASGLASGTYFYKLVTPDKTDVRKMILMK
ncbi:MAG: T9SS type A sorting domain-containing protein, partial [Ignavibacteriaceae bacterium]|nr:T9SS type A sorting domain-containing protein [Ignavibacteriaceae bacterium]